MRKINFPALVAASFAVSACGSEKTGTFEAEDGSEGTYIVDQDGDDVSVQASSEDGDFSLETGDDINVDLPMGFTVYPGAKVISNMTVDQGDGGGTVVTMESGASADDLLSHYRAEAENAGIEIKADMNVQGMQVLAGEGAGGVSFTVRAGEGDDGTNSVTLMIGKDS